MGGKSSAAVSDVVAGASQIKESVPAAKIEVEKIAKDPVPVVVAAAVVVAAEADKKSQ